jgi:hypothetical protein
MLPEVGRSSYLRSAANDAANAAILPQCDANVLSKLAAVERKKARGQNFLSPL